MTIAPVIVIAGQITPAIMPAITPEITPNIAPGGFRMLQTTTVMINVDHIACLRESL